MTIFVMTGACCCSQVFLYSMPHLNIAALSQVYNQLVTIADITKKSWYRRRSSLKHVNALCNVPAVSHVAVANCCWTVGQLPLDSRPTVVGQLANYSWTLDAWPSQVIWISIYSPRSSHRKSSCFTRKTTSHPAHTSNLGKVGTVPYIIRPWTHVNGQA